LSESRRHGIAAWHPAFLLATWFGCGLLPLGPGTWGSLAAVALAWPLVAWGGTPALAAATVAVLLVGWWAAATYVRRTGIDDPREVVIDEVAGQWLTLLFVPLDPLTWLAGLAAFRLFDIWKPWPVRWADRSVAGGLGVMLDDVLAALYAMAVLAVLQLVRR
jgi:phosphatidylglycerophosphatase A